MDILLTIVASILLLVGFLVLCRVRDDDEDEEEEGLDARQETRNEESGDPKS